MELASSLCMDFEGFHAHPYLCPAGVWTIGYGRVLKDGEGRFLRRVDAKPAIKTDEECEQAWLSGELSIRLARVRGMLRVGLSAGKEAALLDFAFNMGLGALRASTLLKRVNAGDWGDVPHQFRRWKFGGGLVLRGLVRRRDAEIALWEGSF